MKDANGFQKVGRVSAPKRSVDERVRDYLPVHTSLPAAALRLQAARCMDCGVPFCASGCPLGNLIPDWNDLVHEARWRDAIVRLHRTNNFPEFTGMLCPAPCEASCVLAINDDAVTIKNIEQAIIERAFENGWVQPEPPLHRTGKRVAVVGSGPAGLAAAQQMNRAGHTVTVFEKDDRLGGLLRYGIPDFKIEKWLIDRRIDQLVNEGIVFVPNTQVGKDVPVADMRRDFDAILVAVGALEGRDVQVPGRDLDGIHFAMDYLVQQNRRVAGDRMDGAPTITARDKRVVVLGGGDTSADCLGNAHREGALSVEILTHGQQPPERPDPLTWPDWPLILRTHPAHEEGGDRYWNVTVTGFGGSNAEVAEVQVVQVEPGNEGNHDRIPGTERRIEADLVLLSVGFRGPVRDRLLTDLNIDIGENGCIASDGEQRTSVDGIFVAGDARRGASLIVWAIAEGRRAAKHIERYLSEEEKKRSTHVDSENGGSSLARWA